MIYLEETFQNYRLAILTAKKVSLFAEIANSDEDDSDLGYLVGMRVKF